MWTAILATAVSLFLIDLPSATPRAQPRAPESGDREELTRLENVWNEAHVKGDAEALDRLWADDLLVTVSGMPLMNKPESLAMIRAGRMGFSKYDTSELVIRTYGDSAVVTGRVQRERRMGDRQVSDDWRFTKVYFRLQGRWRVVSWHASPRL